MGSIVEAVDDRLRATRCGAAALDPLDAVILAEETAPPSSCRKDGQRCCTHDLWAELDRQVSLYLNSVSLADVCERRVCGSARLFPPEEVIEGAVPAGDKLPEDGLREAECA